MDEYVPDIRDLIDAYTYADGLERSKERRETAQKILDQHDAEVRKQITDHQQAAIEAGARAYDPEAWTAYDRESPSTEGRDLMVEYSKSKAESILAAAEPHLRKKWAKEIIDELDTARAIGKIYTYGGVQDLIREGANK